ncbi:ribosome assembly cofactor RimP [Mycoplasmopsis alligatoris]|uniref:Ribosome maturation factor RimP n=1 Tax=Mycoplasmopsis alligatoris A21JP2 TaxID=747682 RepID=D4XWG3_9BACT|nr:ribosome assembly cofactor RimP [Mycoplasmopsis alligatoris]EFF41304.1 hypothetical protein MALL_0467 [Mycoplasmopsis alligatoris A21JP2]
MSILEAIKKNFPIVLEIKEIQNNKDKTLEITLDCNDLLTVEKYSRQIYEYLETNNLLDDSTNLEVFSKGSDIEIKLDEVNNHLNKKVLVGLKNPIQNLNPIPGKILSVSNDHIVLHWNNKGQFRKVEILKENITYIKVDF